MNPVESGVEQADRKQTPRAEALGGVAGVNAELRKPPMTPTQLEIPPGTVEVSPEYRQNNDGSVKKGTGKAHVVVQDEGDQVQQGTTVSNSATSDNTGAKSLVSTAGLSASDSDAIENGWIQAARLIIDQTKGDPYTKQKQISLLQAEYLKKRHGYDIEVDS